MFCYTSGTTGDPKAAQISHGNCLGCIAGTREQGVLLNENDSYLSYLPMAHCFEKLLGVYAMLFGLKLGFYSGDPAKIMEDLQALKPTLFPSVPRLFNRVYDKIQDQVKNAGFVKSTLFSQALYSKTYYYEQQASYSHLFWDTLVFNKIRNLLGGNVRIMVTGSAPISHDVLKFLKVCFACPIYEGYGQTETAAAATLTYEQDNEVGHVGGPMVNIAIKLMDLPEMNYLSTDKNPRGEICFKGPSVFKGYF